MEDNRWLKNLARRAKNLVPGGSKKTQLPIIVSKKSVQGMALAQTSRRELDTASEDVSRRSAATSAAASAYNLFNSPRASRTSNLQLATSARSSGYLLPSGKSGVSLSAISAASIAMASSAAYESLEKQLERCATLHKNGRMMRDHLMALEKFWKGYYQWFVAACPNLPSRCYLLGIGSLAFPFNKSQDYPSSVQSSISQILAFLLIKEVCDAQGSHVMAFQAFDLALTVDLVERRFTLNDVDLLNSLGIKAFKQYFQPEAIPNLLTTRTLFFISGLPYSSILDLLEFALTHQRLHNAVIVGYLPTEAEVPKMIYEKIKIFQVAAAYAKMSNPYNYTASIPDAMRNHWCGRLVKRERVYSWTMQSAAKIHQTLASPSTSGESVLYMSSSPTRGDTRRRA